jgi:hypothetical protein
LCRAADAQQQNVPGSIDAGASDGKPRFGVGGEAARRRQNLELQLGIGGAQRGCDFGMRSDDEEPPSIRWRIGTVQCGKERGDEIASGDERQQAPFEPRQHAQNPAVAKREPGRAVDRQQARGFIMGLHDVVGVRRDHVTVRRAAARDDEPHRLALRQQAEGQPEEFGMRGIRRADDRLRRP